MPIPFHLQLRKTLIAGAKARLLIIKKGKSKAKYEAQTAEDARILLERAEFYTQTEERARKFIERSRDFVDSVFTPTHQTKLDKILEA